MAITSRTARPLLLDPTRRETQLRRGTTEAHFPESGRTRILVSVSSHATLGVSSTQPCKPSQGAWHAEPRNLITKCGALGGDDPLRQLLSSALVRGDTSRTAERGTKRHRCTQSDSAALRSREKWASPFLRSCQNSKACRSQMRILQSSARGGRRKHSILLLEFCLSGMCRREC